MTAIAFVDPMAPKPYSGAPGELAGLGGTEATLVKVAEQLSLLAPVTVLQPPRSLTQMVGGVGYAGFDSKKLLAGAPEVIVVINSWKVAVKLARRNPATRVLLWLHVFPGRHQRGAGQALKDACVEVICVSATHARWLRNFYGAAAPRIGHIHNPIADDLRPEDTPRDPNLLLFASSPHKGLSQVLDHYGALRARLPTVRLAIADPGYLAWPVPKDVPGLLWLGRQDHASLIGWMRRALCLFYPQTQFHETFGLVIAEANAVGCPAILCGGIGANDEIASDPGQCLVSADPAAIATRISALRRADPTLPPVGPRPEFRLSNVSRRWAELLLGQKTALPDPRPALALALATSPS